MNSDDQAFLSDSSAFTKFDSGRVFDSVTGLTNLASLLNLKFYGYTRNSESFCFVK